MRAIWLASVVVAMARALARPDIHYRAAVVELAPILAQNGVPPRSVALQIELRNVAIADAWAEKAAAAGAEIVVFSEDYADSGLALSALAASRFTVALPEPGPESLCTEEESPNPVARALACSARKHGIHIVTGISDVGPCVKHLSPFTHTAYPCNATTNRTQFNSMAAFGPNGALLAKYHKSHLANGPGLEFDGQWAETDTPEVITFESSFGVRFGMLICNDLNFGGPALSLLKAGVRDFVLSTSWLNYIEIYRDVHDAIGVQDGFARAHRVNLIAANTDVGGKFSSGSGIWPADPTAPFVQHYNPTPLASSGWMGIVNLTSPGVASNVPPPAQHPAGAPAIGQTGTSDHVFFCPVPGRLRLSASTTNISCHLEATFKNGGGIYALFAKSGLTMGGWYSAECIVVACASPDLAGCEYLPDTHVPGGGAVFSNLILNVNATNSNVFFHSALCGGVEVPSPRSSLKLTEVAGQRELSFSADCPLLTIYVDSRAQAEDERAECPPGLCALSTEKVRAARALMAKSNISRQPIAV